MKRALTGLLLENFRSIKGPVELDLAPITLLYGPNSAGKTAIAQALHLTRDLCAGEDAFGPAYLTAMHHRNYEERMVLGVRFTEGWFQGFINEETVGISFELYEEILPELYEYMNGDEICNTTFEIRFEIGFNWIEHTRHGTRLISSVEKEMIAAGGSLLLVNERDRLSIHTDHHLIHSVNRCLRGKAESLATLARSVFNRDALTIEHDRIVLRARNDFWERRFTYDFNDEAIFNDGMQASLKQRLFEAIIGSIYFVPLKIAERLLDEMCHIGPLRHIPSERQLTYLLAKGGYESDYIVRDALEQSSSSWIDGASAWKSLAENKTLHQFYGKQESPAKKINLLDSVNEWLSSKQRLGMNHTVVVTYGTVQLLTDQEPDSSDGPPENSSSRLFPERIARLQLKDANLDAPVEVKNVGAGVPQLVPIITAGFEHNYTVVIEQPELHLHPKLQTEVADYFLSRWSANKVRFIIETHSEYLALRLLRRIRETGSADIKHRMLSICESDVAFYYFDPIGGVTNIKRLRVSPEGEFIDRWPKGFFAEREAELFDEDD